VRPRDPAGPSPQVTGASGFVLVGSVRPGGPPGPATQVPGGSGSRVTRGMTAVGSSGAAAGRRSPGSRGRSSPPSIRWGRYGSPGVVTVTLPDLRRADAEWTLSASTGDRHDADATWS